MTLSEMRKLRIPDGVEWELLVVNNNSTDHTDQVILRHEKELPIRRLFEPKQGHSNSRNCAVAAADGDLILWTDDDVLVDTEWLAAYHDAARLWPDAAFFGGTIEPWFEIEPPGWFKRNIKALRTNYALCSYDPTVRPLAPGEIPFGANMAFRAKVLKGHTFDVRLGRVGHSMVGWDETSLIKRLEELGHHGIWVGTARVRHYIPGDRLTLSYLWRWHQGAGKTAVRMEGLPECKFLWGAPCWAWKQYWDESFKSMLLSPLKGAAWLSAYTKAAHSKGLIEESRVESRRARMSGISSAIYTPRG